MVSSYGVKKSEEKEDVSSGAQFPLGTQFPFGRVKVRPILIRGEYQKRILKCEDVDILYLSTGIYLKEF